jgi:hypothetical protein
MTRWLTLLLLVASCKKAMEPTPHGAKIQPPPAVHPTPLNAKVQPPPVRPTTAGSVDIYIDGLKLRSIQVADLKGSGKALRGLIDGPVAKAVVHGDRELIVPPEQLDELELQLNKRGDLIKVGGRDGAGGIRAVTWIEFHRH